MKVSTSMRDRVAIIRLEGRFDFSSHREFREAVKAAINDPAVHELEVDLAEAQYIDSAALGMLLLSRENAIAAGKTIVLARPAGAVRQVLDIANFQKLFAYR